MSWIRPLFCMGCLVGAAVSVSGPAGAVACTACITQYCPAIMPACVWVPPPGPGAFACMAAFCGIPCGAACAAIACFDNSTQFSTPSGYLPVWSLKKGDMVLTEVGFTPVTDVGYIEQNVDMVTLTVASGASLTTTDAHEHFILELGRTVQKRSAELKVGMVMAEAQNKTNNTIVAITKSVKPGKWTIATQSCTAYANGVLTGASCSKNDLAAVPHSGRSSGLQGASGMLEDVSSNKKVAACVGNTSRNSSGAEGKACAERAGAYILSLDGQMNSVDTTPEEIGRALEEDTGSWRLKKVEF